MKIDLDKTAANTIVAYDVGHIHVHGSKQTSDGIVPHMQIVTASAIITPDVVIEGWQPNLLSELTPAHMQIVLEFQPEIVLLGTGRSLRFPAAEILQICHQAGIGIEVMDTGAACRTYNILAAEGRRVVAAMLMIESAASNPE